MANFKSREDQKKSVGFMIVECLENEGVDTSLASRGREYPTSRCLQWIVNSIRPGSA